jgi:hypothetical protein
VTAAWLYGVDVQQQGDADIHVWVPPGHRLRSRKGIVVREATLEPSECWEMRGVTADVAGEDGSGLPAPVASGERACRRRQPGRTPADDDR